MKKICITLITAMALSMFVGMTVFAAPAGATTLPNGDKQMSFSLGGGSSTSSGNSTTSPKPSAPASNVGGTSSTSKQCLTHKQAIQLGKDMAEEYGLEWHDGPKKTFDMPVSASHTESSWKDFYNISYAQYVEAGYDSIYIEIFHDGNEYVLRIYR